MKIYDISQPVSSRTAVWPGDQRFELAWSMQKERGDSVNVAAVTLSVHTGTHIDGGYHFANDGARAAGMPLERYIGPAQVIDARGVALDERLADRIDFALAPRVLLRTRDRVDETEFPAEFHAPTPGLARSLIAAGVTLFGTDAPSVDPVDSKTLDVHHLFGSAGVAILENLVLDEVEAGRRYTLIALPLRLVDADSSPVRAVLVDGPLDG